MKRKLVMTMLFQIEAKSERSKENTNILIYIERMNPLIP